MDQADNALEKNQQNRLFQSFYYEIRVEGQLDSSWSEWFDGLEVASQENGETRMAGLIPDQAELHGVLNTVFELRLPLLSVKRIQLGS